MPVILPVKDKSPSWGQNCFIAENATIVGDVVMGDKCSVWFNAVIRGDVNYIKNWEQLKHPGWCGYSLHL
jgi:carbonic anhydrase/acetyltransferase-like protein (isoleucine patch superfamily)